MQNQKYIQSFGSAELKRNIEDTITFSLDGGQTQSKSGNSMINFFGKMLSDESIDQCKDLTADTSMCAYRTSETSCTDLIIGPFCTSHIESARLCALRQLYGSIVLTPLKTAQYTAFPLLTSCMPLDITRYELTHYFAPFNMDITDKELLLRRYEFWLCKHNDLETAYNNTNSQVETILPMRRIYSNLLRKYSNLLKKTTIDLVFTIENEAEFQRYRSNLFMAQRMPDKWTGADPARQPPKNYKQEENRFILTVFLRDLNVFDIMQIMLFNPVIQTGYVGIIPNIQVLNNQFVLGTELYFSDQSRKEYENMKNKFDCYHSSRVQTRLRSQNIINIVPQEYLTIAVNSTTVENEIFSVPVGIYSLPATCVDSAIAPSKFRLMR